MIYTVYLSVGRVLCINTIQVQFRAVRGKSMDSFISHFRVILSLCFKTSFKTFYIKMSLICMKMNLLVEHIFHTENSFDRDVKGNSEIAYCLERNNLLLAQLNNKLLFLCSEFSRTISV